MFRLPATVHADSPTGLSSLTPTLNGPLVRTSLFQHDIENATRHYTNSTTSTAWDSINYIRLTEYAWAVDPFEDGDSTRDYYIVFVSATVQAGGTDQNGHPWCLYNRADYGSENLKIRTQLGTILGDKVSPVNTVHGDAIATIGFNLGLALGGGQGTTGSVSAGISWSQTIFDWTTEVVSLNSTEVSWRTTISHGFFPGVEDCNTDAWVWGYAAAISVGQGQTPVIDVSFTGTFYIPGSLCNNNIWVTILSPIGSLLLGCLILPSLSQAHPIERPPISTGAVNLSIPSRLKVLFETNPLVGSIAFRSTSESAFGSGVEFGHDEYSGFTPGTYYATAIPPEDYVFDHWE